MNFALAKMNIILNFGLFSSLMLQRTAINQRPGSENF